MSTDTVDWDRFQRLSSDGDQDAMTFALLDVKEFQHQQERQMQSVINHLAMLRTIKGSMF